jgi:hypothetical protein
MATLRVLAATTLLIALSSAAAEEAKLAVPVEESKAELEEELNFLPAFTDSVMMIWATELGDKTFFIAAILAMRYNRLIIFSGAIGALAVMTVISAMMGFALPNLMPKKYAHYTAAALYLYFGVILLKVCCLSAL